jgi:hypothetical protein
MSTGFEVDPGALRVLGERFAAAADGLDTRVQRFSARARLPGGALGRVPDAQAAEAHYERRLQDALDSLGRLRQALRQVSAGLTTVADNYEASDRAAAGGSDA